MGKFGEDIVNDNGERLIGLCSAFDMKIMNGFYQHKQIHKYTWIQPTRNLKTIIDYVIQRQKSELKTMDIRALRGAECGTDHVLLRAKVLFTYKCQAKRDPQQPIQEKVEEKIDTNYTCYAMTQSNSCINYG